MQELKFYNEIISNFTMLIVFLTFISIIVPIIVPIFLPEENNKILFSYVLLGISICFIAVLAYRYFRAKFHKFYLVNQLAILTGDILWRKKENMEKIREEFTNIQRLVQIVSFCDLWCFYRENNRKKE